MCNFQFRCCGNAGCVDFRDYRMDVPRSCDYRCDGCRYRIWNALSIGATITASLMLIVVLAQVRCQNFDFIRICYNFE